MLSFIVREAKPSFTVRVLIAVMAWPMDKFESSTLAISCAIGAIFGAVFALIFIDALTPKKKPALVKVKS